MLIIKIIQMLKKCLLWLMILVLVGIIDKYVINYKLFCNPLGNTNYFKFDS